MSEPAEGKPSAGKKEREGMKQTYIQPELETIILDAQDIITASMDPDPDEGGHTPFP